MSEVILYEVTDGIARITLNRPERLNAFGPDMASEWARVTADATGRSDVRAVLLAGNGRAFCAGGDVRAMAEGGLDGEQITSLAHVINRGQLSLLRSALPVVAAAHGTTAGGGLGILLTSDYAVLGESSKVGSLYANVGLTPDLTVSALLGRAVGERRAMQLVLQDRLLSAAEALSWGLAAEVVPDVEVQTRAEQIAEFWAENAPGAYGQAKRLIRSSAERSTEEQLAEEARTIGQAIGTAEARGRIAAFAGR